MSIIKQNWGLRLLNKAANLANMSVVPNARAIATTPLLRVMGFSVVWGVWNEERYIREGYMQNATLYAIVNRIVRTAATAPFKVYRIKDQKKHEKIKALTGPNANKASIIKAMLLKELAYEEDSKHPMNGLLERPNPWQSGSEFVTYSIAFKLLTGNRFLRLTVLDLGANGGAVAAIVNLPPQNTGIVGDGTLFGVSEYILNLGQQIHIPENEMIHSKYFNPNINSSGEHLRGLSPASAGARNLDILSSAEERTLSTFENAGAAGMLFDRTPDGMTEVQAGALKRKLNEEVLGKSNAGKIVVGNGDLAYLDFAKTTVEMASLEEKRFSKQQLCDIYGVPYILFSSDSSSYNNIQEAKKELITMAVVPELASLRDDYNRIAKKFGADDIYIDYDLSVYPELQEDLEKTSKVMAASWWIKPNEKRIAMGYDEDSEDEMMNSYLVPSSLVELSTLNPANIDNQMNQVDEQLNNTDQSGL